MHHGGCVVQGPGLDPHPGSHIYILIRSSPPRHDCAGNVGNEIDDRETGAECGYQGLCVIILMTTVMTVIMLLMVITRAVKILRAPHFAQV